MRFLKLLPGVLLLVCLIAPGAPATWKRRTYERSYPRVVKDEQPISYSRTHLWWCKAWAQLNICAFYARDPSGAPAPGVPQAAVDTAARMSGDGLAEDGLPFIEASAAVQGTSLEYSSYKHETPPNVGEVEWWKEVFIRGEVDLVEPECGGWVLGWAEAKTLCDTETHVLKARLTTSEGSTGSSNIVSVNVLGTNFNISSSIGTGPRPDDAGGTHYRGPVAKCPVVVFEADDRVTANIRVWANSWGWGLTHSKMTARLDLSYAHTDFLLIEHFQCPLNAAPVIANSTWTEEYTSAGLAVIGNGIGSPPGGGTNH